MTLKKVWNCIKEFFSYEETYPMHNAEPIELQIARETTMATNAIQAVTDYINTERLKKGQKKAKIEFDTKSEAIERGSDTRAYAISVKVDDNTIKRKFRVKITNIKRLSSGESKCINMYDTEIEEIK